MKVLLWCNSKDNPKPCFQGAPKFKTQGSWKQRLHVQKTFQKHVAKVQQKEHENIVCGQSVTKENDPVSNQGVTEFKTIQSTLPKPNEMRKSKGTTPRLTSSVVDRKREEQCAIASTRTKSKTCKAT
jgi:hypothetical protein